MGHGSETRIVVLCPLETERAAVARALRRGGMTGVEVLRTGMGAAAGVAAEREIGKGPCVLILAGLCGAVGPGVRASVPRVRCVIDEGGRGWFPSLGRDGRLREEEGLTLVGVGGVVGTAAAKQALHAGTGAHLVDTESHQFAAACARAGVRWAVVRGVLDGAEDELPAEVAGWVDASGRTRAGRVVLDLLRRPGLVPRVVWMGRRSGAVLPEVGRRVAEIVLAWRDQNPEEAGEQAGGGGGGRSATSRAATGVSA